MSDPGNGAWWPDRRTTLWRGRGKRTVTYYGTEPVRTRDLHPALWPFELAGRAEAVVRGILLRRRGTVERRRP